MEQEHQRSTKIIMRTLAFTLVMSVMSATMFNVILPSIALEFQLSTVQVSWVSSAYMLVYGIGTVIYGRLSDSFRLKSLLGFGLCLFSFGSIFGLLSQTYWMVLVARVFQAIGAAVIPAMAMIIPIRLFPLEERGQALGMVAAAIALGSSLGPVVSTFIVSFAHWRWLFLLPTLVVGTLPFYFKHLDNKGSNVNKFDWIGAGLFAGVIACLLLAITNGSWGLAGISMTVFLLFLLRINTTKTPFMEVRLFQNKRFSLGLVIAFVFSSISFAIPFLSPLLLSDVYRLPPQVIGFVIIPGTLISALMGKGGGEFLDKRGDTYVVSLAATLFVISFILLSSFAGVFPIWIVFFLILSSLGQTLMSIALSRTMSETLSEEQIGVGMGTFQMLNFIAGAVSGIIYSKVIDLGPIIRINRLNPNAAAIVYSNIYLVLALLMIGISLTYYLKLGKPSHQKDKLMRGERNE